MANVRVPQLVSLEIALKTYYERIELNNKDVKALFGNNISTATISRLKKRAREQMVADGVQSWNAVNVNTRSAFKSWGLDIGDLEERFNKLKELEL